eukprot:GDKJ01063794.1.p1 GENE.GDKJ01063794.1~~GDKJ01063794.1.p1  ORF type:complete len:215 (-),score=47.47 GDKJ01063794.1:48-602(-)
MKQSTTVKHTPNSVFSKQDKQEVAKPGVKVAFSSEQKTIQNTESDIWSEEELRNGNSLVEVDDGRSIAEYEILYRQKVAAEDMFLGLSDMDPSTDHCREFTVKIKVPGTTMKQISLDVTDERLIMQGPKHKLNIALPYAVDSDNGSAKFDPRTCVLSVILPIRCKIDYVDVRALNEARNAQKLN